MHISAEWGRYEWFFSKVATRLELKMNQSGQENQGTGPRDVFDILVKTPTERLLSLTLQLSESPEGNVVRVLCLIALQRERQALSRLHTLGDSCLSQHLYDTFAISKGNLEEFAVHFGNFNGFTLESLVLLARVFKVLSEQQLCDPQLRDLAYQRALSKNDHASNKLGYEQLKEEAMAVCGPQFAEWMCSCVRGLDSLCVLDSSQDEEGALSEHKSESTHSLPTSLHANSSMFSYPTHLEISTPPTALFHEDKGTLETPNTSEAEASVLLVSKVDVKNASEPYQTSEEPLKSSKFAADRLVLHSFPGSTPTTGQSVAAPSTCVLTNMSAAADLCCVEEEEAIFYAFVIMHAPEDADVADCVREKVEKVIGCKGATFSDDFHTPGKSTLRCVEDAINNTAFTFLLLTRNFTTRMVELETNSALINSLYKKHKWNTVIPLLPMENCMPKREIPLVLQTLVPLEESKNFGKKLKNSLTLAKIKRQEKIWMEEQRVKIQKAQLQHQKQLKHCEKVQWQETKKPGQTILHNPNLLGEDSAALWQMHPNIHIENANYIMIGNDSQMTVGVGGGEDKDNSIKEEQ